MIEFGNQVLMGSTQWLSGAVAPNSRLDPFEFGDNMKNEIWKDIPGWEGYYQASTHGGIRSLDRYIYHKNKNKYFRKGRVLTYKKNIEERPVIQLWKNRQYKQYKIHTLIMETFVGKRPFEKEVCHYDGNKFNNKLNNLRYDTRQGNADDNVRLGIFKGEGGGNVKLKKCEVLFIRYLRNKKVKRDLIAKMFKCPVSRIDSIIYRKSWKHI